MNRVNGFITFENAMCEYYYATKKKYDNLGSMLADLDTSVWVPPEGTPLISGDPAIFKIKWTKAWDRIIGEESDGTPEQVFLVAKTLLDYYTNEVEFDLGYAEDYLKSALGIEERIAL